MSAGVLLKRDHNSIRGCGVAEAQRTFTPRSGGSNPSGLIIGVQLDGPEQRSYKSKVEGSIPSTPN
jgi:hypothetical protein